MCSRNASCLSVVYSYRLGGRQSGSRAARSRALSERAITQFKDALARNRSLGRSSSDRFGIAPKGQPRGSTYTDLEMRSPRGRQVPSASRSGRMSGQRSSGTQNVPHVRAHKAKAAAVEPDDFEPRKPTVSMAAPHGRPQIHPDRSTQSRLYHTMMSRKFPCIIMQTACSQGVEVGSAQQDMPRSVHLHGGTGPQTPNAPSAQTLDLSNSLPRKTRIRVARRMRSAYRRSRTLAFGRRSFSCFIEPAAKPSRVRQSAVLVCSRTASAAATCPP